MKTIGTIMMSSNNSIESAARPTGVFVPEMGSTMAVLEKARAKPSASAPVVGCPIIESASARQLPMISSSSAPRPKTSLRICHKRLKDSSSPMVKSSRIIPKSAKGPSPSGSEIVTWRSQRTSSVNWPSPNGPTRMPIRINPMTGVMRKRVKTGMTMPAAPRITSASLIIGDMESSPAMS